jgi:hypothetical protein
LTEHQNLPDGAFSALLPWESQEAFLELRSALIDEHAPIGATQLSLIDRIADIIWKRQRIRLAERSLHLSNLRSSMGGYSDRQIGKTALITSKVERPSTTDRSAITTVASDDKGHAEYYRDELADLNKAISILEAGNTKAAKDAALNCLRKDTIEWWESLLEHDEDNVLDSVEGLHGFLVSKVLPELEKLIRGVDQRPEIRLHAWGESMDPIQLARLISLDTELDRQYERNLGVLLKLQAMKAQK